MVVVLLNGCYNTTFAQSNNENTNVVYLDISKLDASTRSLIKNESEKQSKEKEITQKIETYSKWAGKGKEIGIGVRESLMAIKDVTVELSESEVGKVTIWLVVWNFAGRDIIRMFIGFILLMLTSFIIIRSYVKTFSRKVLIKGGFFQPKEWETVSYRDSYWRYPNAAAMSHFFVLLSMWGICVAIMFG